MIAPSPCSHPVGAAYMRPADCRKRCAHPLAPSARGLRPQAVGERTVRQSEIFRAMARFSPSAPTGHLPRRGRSACQKTSTLLYRECRGDHWSPASLAQQRAFRDGFLTRHTGTGEQCSPLQEFFDSRPKRVSCCLLQYYYDAIRLVLQ